MGLNARDLGYHMSEFYKEMAPEVAEYVQPIIQKMLDDPISYATSFAVVTALLGRLISGNLEDMGGISFL